MATPKELQPGAIFFHVTYYDDELLIPAIQTLEFEFKEADESGEDFWVFREPGSDGAATDGGEPLRIGFKEDALEQLLGFDELSAVVAELRSVRVAPVPAPGAPAARYSPDIAAIERKILELEASARRSLHISARYTDNGIFVQRSGDGCNALLITHPLRSAQVDKRVSELLKRWHLRPFKDYLADRGRTRLVSVKLPEDVRRIALICAEMFSIVYESDADTELRFDITD